MQAGYTHTNCHLWFDDERINSLVGNFQKDSKTRRRPFEQPDPSLVEQMKAEWDKKQQANSQKESAAMLTQRTRDKVFEFTEVDDIYDSNESDGGLVQVPTTPPYLLTLTARRCNSKHQKMTGVGQGRRIPPTVAVRRSQTAVGISPTAVGGNRIHLTNNG